MLSNEYLTPKKETIFTDSVYLYFKLLLVKLVEIEIPI